MSPPNPSKPPIFLIKSSYVLANGLNLQSPASAPINGDFNFIFSVKNSNACCLLANAGSEGPLTFGVIVLSPEFRELLPADVDKSFSVIGLTSIILPSASTTVSTGRSSVLLGVVGLSLVVLILS